jgi:hypothetical protein
MFLSAIVQVPEGFDEHPEALYREMVFEGHFPTGFGDFRTTPPDPNLKPDYFYRFHLAGYTRIQQQAAYEEYKKWISPGFPRVLITSDKPSMQEALDNHVEKQHRPRQTSEDVNRAAAHAVGATIPEENDAR